MTPRAAALVRLLGSLPPLLLLLPGHASSESPLVGPSTSPQTRHYEWKVGHKITDSSFRVDCDDGRLTTLVDGSFPGPAIRANVGDKVVVKVTNMSPVQGTSIHWHGLHMSEEPYMDGVTGFTQCALSPGQEQTYEFVAREAGTHYWHSHISLQHSDGMAGPLYVYDAGSKSNDGVYGGVASEDGVGLYDEELDVFLSDWYDEDATYQRTGLDSVPFKWIGNPDAILINGKGRRLDDDVCDETQYHKWEVEQGKTYRLRIVGSSNLLALNFAVAGHKLTIVEADGTLTKPLEVESVDVSPGQRYSVLLKADAEIGTYAAGAVTRARSRDGTGMGRAFLVYKGAADADLATVAVPSQPGHDEFDAPYGVTFDASLRTKEVPAADEEGILDADPDVSYVIVGTQNLREEDNRLRWAVNNVSMAMPYPKETTIALAHDAAKRIDEEGAEFTVGMLGEGYVPLPLNPPNTWDYAEDSKELLPGPGKWLGETAVPVVNLKVGQVVQMVFQNSRALNGVAELHPWHMHGHSFYQVGQGIGTYDPDVHDATFNLEDPIARDTLTIYPNGWVAIRFKAYHAGVWDVHCHLNSHLIMGMGFVMIVSPGELGPPPPAAISCSKNDLGRPGPPKPEGPKEEGPKPEGPGGEEEPGAAKGEGPSTPPPDEGEPVEGPEETPEGTADPESDEEEEESGGGARGAGTAAACLVVAAVASATMG